jgi:iron complex outermembrane receptor protein
MLNLMANAKLGKWEFSASPFYNYFINYIYLAPTNEDWFGFPVYRYKQQNARQYGSEASMAYNVNAALRISASYSGMISQTADGRYTPYVPAQKITPALAYNFKVKKLKSLVFYTNGDMVFAQNKVALYERGSSDYFLLNAGMSTSFRGKSKLYTISISGNNLLNRAYYDNLSRFKNYGLLNIGTNVALNLVIHFDN